MIGYAYAAGDRRGSVRANAGQIAEYFSLAPGLLGRVMDHIETDERPQVVLLQNTAPEASVGAVTFYSSVWSKSYAKVGTAYGAVHRDFHSSETSCVDLVMLRCTLTRSCSSGKTYYR